MDLDAPVRVARDAGGDVRSEARRRHADHAVGLQRSMTRQGGYCGRGDLDDPMWRFADRHPSVASVAKLYGSTNLRGNMPGRSPLFYPPLRRSTRVGHRAARTRGCGRTHPCRTPPLMVAWPGLIEQMSRGYPHG